MQFNEAIFSRGMSSLITNYRKCQNNFAAGSNIMIFSLYIVYKKHDNEDKIWKSNHKKTISIIARVRIAARCI